MDCIWKCRKKEVLSGLSEMRLFLIGIFGAFFCDGSAVGAVAFQSCMWAAEVHDQYSGKSW